MPGMEGFINFNGTLEGSIAGGGGGDVKDVKVRDSQETEFESVVNEQGVAEIDLISYVRRNELTQAIENVENSIDNVVELVDTKQNIINYSFEEQNTGIKWINGKSIYQKTKIFTSVPQGEAVYNIDVNDVEKIIKLEVNGYRTEDNYQLCNSIIFPSWLAGSIGINFIKVTSTQIGIIISNGYYPLADVCVTFFYTKSTD